MRLGVVLLVPAPVAGEVDGLRRALGDGALGRIPPHVTLVPPVNVRAEDMEEALSVLRRAAAGAGPLVLELGPVATFWPESPVLYLEVGGEGAGEVAALRRRLGQPPLRREAGRPFVPHVTVCEESAPAAIHAAVAALGGYRATVVVDRVHLLAEGPGRLWEPLADAALGPPAVVARGGLALELAVTDRADPEAAAWATAAWAAYGRETYGPGWVADVPFAVTARRDGQVVGLARGHVQGASGGVCLLALLVVEAAARSQGVGSHLLGAVEHLAAERGCQAVRAWTLAGGRAEDLYRRRGWVVTGLLPAWREGRDFVVMERRLSVAPPLPAGLPGPRPRARAERARGEPGPDGRAQAKA